MPPHSDVSKAAQKMKGPGAVFSALLFVATFVLFPYVGMLLRITCSHSSTTDLLFHDLRQRVPTSAQSNYLDTGEKELLLSLYMCFNKGRHLVLFYTTECEYILIHWVSQCLSDGVIFWGVLL